MKTYKGFDKDLKCKDHQYAVGETYETQLPIKICESGFHGCKNPLDVLFYYPYTGTERYAEIEQSGDTQIHYQDSKVCSSKITIKSEINFLSLIKLGVERIYNTVDKDKKKAVNSGAQSNSVNPGYRSNSVNSGDQSNSVNSGARSNSVNSGYQSNSVNSGDWSNSVVHGKQSIAITTGYKSKAKGALGCWIVMAEWDEQGANIVNVKSHKVDGKVIEPDTFYTLKNGRFVKSE